MTRIREGVGAWIASAQIAYERALIYFGVASLFTPLCAFVAAACVAILIGFRAGEGHTVPIGEHPWLFVPYTLGVIFTMLPIVRKIQR